MSFDLRDHFRGGLVAVLAVALVAAPLAGAQGLDDRPTVQLSLHECLRLAMDNNLDIAVGRYNLEINEQGILRARSPLESVFTSTYAENEANNQNVDPFSGRPISTQKQRSFTANWNDPTVWGGNFNVFFFGNKQKNDNLLFNPAFITALNFRYQQSILRNFGLEVNRAPIRIAQNTHKISAAQFQDTVQNTAQTTEFAYWDLVFSRLDLEVKRQSLTLAEELLAMNKAKVEVGTLAPIDVTQAEAGVASREEDVIVAEAAVENAEDALRQMINPPANSAIWMSAIIPSDQPAFKRMAPDMESALETARQRRPDLQQQRLRVTSNQLQEKLDKKQSRWDLTFQGDYNLEGVEGRLIDPFSSIVTLDTGFPDAVSGLSETEFADWTLSTTLTIPLGNKDAKARHMQSRLRRQQSEVSLDNLLLGAEIDVRRKVRDVTTNVKRVEAARKNRELQEKNVDAEQKKYENGMSTSFQVLEVQEDLATSKNGENLAIIDYMKSLVSLEQSKGTLLEARKIEMTSLDRLNKEPAYTNTDLNGVELRGIDLLNQGR